MLLPNSNKQAYTLRESLNFRTSNRRTICEVLRKANDLLIEMEPNHERRGKIEELLVEAMDMGKRMAAKLAEDKPGWSKEFWEPNHSFEEDINKRGNRG